MKFEKGRVPDLIKLIGDYPLAWLVSHGAGGFDATPLPMLAETDADGELVSLLGHCSRANAQVADLRADPSALLLFMGPQGYMSPEAVSTPRWVPTWNFGVAILAVEIEFVEDETLASVGKLTSAMEAGRPHPWTLDDAGDRIEALLPRIIAFRAHVRNAEPRFKLGQEEKVATLAELIGGTCDATLAAWMQRMNSDRLAALPVGETAR